MLAVFLMSVVGGRKRASQSFRPDRSDSIAGQMGPHVISISIQGRGMARPTAGGRSTIMQSKKDDPGMVRPASMPRTPNAGQTRHSRLF